jgi:hypothetical protein
MEKQMAALAVTTNNGLIVIAQDDVYLEQAVSVEPDQLELLIDWLREAAAEIVAARQAPEVANVQ